MTAAPSQPATSPTAQSPMQQAGRIVPNTTVMLPRTAIAGTTVTGRAPPESTITFDGHDQTVPESGEFALQMPDGPGQSLPVRVQRPGRTAMTLLITLQARQP